MGGWWRGRSLTGNWSGSAASPPGGGNVWGTRLDAELRNFLKGVFLEGCNFTLARLI